MIQYHAHVYSNSLTYQPRGCNTLIDLANDIEKSPET